MTALEVKRDAPHSSPQLHSSVYASHTYSTLSLVQKFGLSPEDLSDFLSETGL